MGSIDMEDGRAAEPPRQVMRGRQRVSRFAAELEGELRHLYLRMMEEPVPARLLGVLRAGLKT
ncbi:MAG TPA: hypothetical protein VFE34_22900 [Dongiaceae bacterium]|jgi:hypothetical protein|nr:hypothetical protein [Dongiaceae bacterium]